MNSAKKSRKTRNNSEELDKSGSNTFAKLSHFSVTFITEKGVQFRVDTTFHAEQSQDYTINTEQFQK